MATPKLRFKEFDGNWKNYKLEDISNIKTGPFGSNLHKEDYVAVGTPIITVEHLGEISLTTQNLPLVSDTDKLRLSAYSLQEGDIAFSRVGSVDRCAIVTKQEKGWLFSGRILRVRPNNKIVFSKHLMYALKTEHSKHQIRSAAVGQTMPSLNTKILKEFIVCLSNSLEEQTKIATFLSAVDTKIDELTQKHELLTDYKKGMMQQIFSQKLRFKADDGSDFEDWELATLDNHIEDSKSKSRINNEYEVFTSSRYGLVSQSEYFENSRLADRDNTGFNIIHPKEITYRSRSDDGMFFFNQNYLGKTGIVSTYYPVFSMVKGNNKFLCEYLNFYKYEYIKHAVGTSQLVLSLNSLKKIKFRIPTKEEQTKIANFLTAIDQKIDNVAEQIDHAKTWKKGLLQQMFV